MSINKIIFIYFIASLFFSLFSQALPSHKKSVFFSEKTQLIEGYLYTELSFPKTIGDLNFRFHQLSYSPRRFWEELRIEGKVETRSEKSYLLKANKCSVYAGAEGIRRWYPIRSFDCDHIQMEIQWEGSNLKILRGPREEIIELKETKLESEEEILGIIVRVDLNGYYGFSSSLRYVLRNAKALFSTVGEKSIEAPILDGNDSLVYIKKQEDLPVKMGDVFKVKRKKSSESFLKL
jgi:hypothetical protein